MHKAEFYAGILDVVKTAQVGPQPTLQPATPAPAPKPFNFGNISLNKPQQNVVNTFNQNKPAFRPYMNQVMTYANSLPDPKQFDPGQAKSLVRSEMIQSIPNAFARGYGQGGIGGALSESWKNFGDLRKVYSGFSGLQSMKPSEQLEVGNQIAAQDPGVEKFMRGQINRGIDSHFNNASAGQLWDDFTGGKNSDTTNAVMNDSQFKARATGAATGRATSLAGDFLKNNWGKLALAVGGGAVLMMLLKHFMSSAQPQQPQIIINNAPAAQPRQSYL